MPCSCGLSTILNHRPEYTARVYGEGIYTPYSFTNGQAYDVRITFSVYVNGPLSSGSNGSINVYAATGLTPGPKTASCGDPIPVLPSNNLQLLKSYDIQTSALTQVAGQKYPLLTIDDVFSITMNTSSSQPAGAVSLNQLWIYPSATNQTNNNNTLIPYPYLGLTVSSIFVCPRLCGTTNQVVNSGTVPLDINQQYVYIGSSVGPPNRTTPVTVASGANTLVIGGDLVDLLPNFDCNPGTGTATFKIQPCNSLYNMTVLGPDIYDAQNIANAGTVDSANSVNLETVNPGILTAAPSAQWSGDSTSLLKVFPTVSSGLFNINGPQTDLSNAYFLVTDESGRTVYKFYNSSGNTNLQLNLGMLNNGLYFLQINNGTKTTTQKIIIQK